MGELRPDEIRAVAKEAFKEYIESFAGGSSGSQPDKEDCFVAGWLYGQLALRKCEVCEAADGRKTVSICAACIRETNLEARKLEREKLSAPAPKSAETTYEADQRRQSGISYGQPAAPKPAPGGEGRCTCLERADGIGPMHGIHDSLCPVGESTGERVSRKTRLLLLCDHCNKVFEVSRTMAQEMNVRCPYCEKKNWTRRIRECEVRSQAG